MHVKYLIIGNNVAGINAAKTLASDVPDGEIVVYSKEPYHYYNRWELPAFLAGEKDLESIYFYPPGWYQTRGIEVNLDTEVTRLHPEAQQVTLNNGQQISYDYLLLCTGSHAFMPPIAGADKEGVFALRTINDALAIQAYASHTEKALVVGGGLLGLEAARSLKALGLEVTVIEMFPRLLPRQLDKEGSALFQEQYEHLGIQVITGVTVTKILGQGQISGLELANGDEVNGEMILFSTGIRCNTQLAQEAGLEVKRGIVTDQWMQTSAPNIYAAGDCVEFQGQLYGIIPASIEQARAAARHMRGDESEPYQGTVPSTTLKLADIHLTCIGQLEPDTDCTFVRFEDHDRGIYRKLILRENQIVGSILLGDRSNVVPVTKLIKGHTDVSRYMERLSEGDLDFRELVASTKKPEPPRYECTICGYIYDPKQGDPEGDVPPDTPFEALPQDWSCPLCGAERDMFVKIAD